MTKFKVKHFGPLTWHEKEDIAARNKGNPDVERLLEVVDELQWSISRLTSMLNEGTEDE